MAEIQIHNTTTDFDVLIVGGGPAGLSAVLQAQKRGLSHILLEKGHFANTIHSYQIGKHVMTEPATLPLRGPLTFRSGLREEVLTWWCATIAKENVNYRKGDVQSIIKITDGFNVTLDDQTVLKSKKVILALGVKGSPRPLSISGEDLPHVTFNLEDASSYVDKDIVIIGAGDAAIENALALCDQNRVTIINRSGDFARANDTNSKLINDAINSDNLKYISNASIKSITAEYVTVQTPNELRDIPCDKVIARTGFLMPRNFLSSCGVTFVNDDPAALPLLSANYETTIPGLFVIGSLTGFPLIKHAINQGFEVIEKITGHMIEPADQQLLESILSPFKHRVDETLALLRFSLPLFKLISNPQFRELITESKIHSKKDGEIIYRQNDYTDSFYSIISGAVVVELGADQTVKLNSGQFFGEMGLLPGRRRFESVRASDDVMLLETPRKMMLKLSRSVKEIQNILQKTFLVRALQTSIFPDIPATKLKRIVASSHIERYTKGSKILATHENSKFCYVINKGSAAAIRTGHLSRGSKSYFKAGDCITNIDINSGVEYATSITVNATTDCEVIAITKDDFKELISEHQDLKDRLKRAEIARNVASVIESVGQSKNAVMDLVYAAGLGDAENVLIIDSDKCIGCNNCESACADTHNGYSRLDRKTGKYYASIQVPASCRHCENPLCMNDCPPDALVRQSNGEVLIKNTCIGCGNCVTACPYGVIQMTNMEEKKKFSLFSLFTSKAEVVGSAKAAKCDMCKDIRSGPACVQACPTGAAIRVDSSTLVQIMARKGDN